MHDQNEEMHEKMKRMHKRNENEQNEEYEKGRIGWMAKNEEMNVA